MKYGSVNVVDKTKSAGRSAWFYGVNGVYSYAGNKFRAAIKCHGVWETLGIFNNRGAAQMAFNLAYVAKGGDNLEAMNDKHYKQDDRELNAWMNDNGYSKADLAKVEAMIGQKLAQDPQMAAYEEMYRGY